MGRDLPSAIGAGAGRLGRGAVHMHINEPPTRIAFCTTHLGLGGAEKALCNLVLRLDRRRWYPAVFHLSMPDSLADELRRAGVPVTLVAARHRWDVSVVARLARALARWRPLVLQTFLFHANIAGRIAGRCAGVPIIVSGARVAERRSRWPLIVDNLTCRMADHTICVSRAVAEFTHRTAHWPRSRLTAIANAVDFERFTSASPADLSCLGIPQDAFVFLFVGRLDRQKGPEYLLDAFAGAHQAMPSAHVLLVGQGPEREALERRCRQAGIDQRVHFAGWRADVAELLKAADVLVAPSLWEGMPNVVLEAMAAGVPVVASRVEGVEELICDGVSGLLVPPGEAGPLAAAMTQIAGCTSLRVRLARAAADVVAREHTLDAMVGAYEQVYGRLLGLAQNTVACC